MGCDGVRTRCAGVMQVCWMLLMCDARVLVSVKIEIGVMMR